MSVIDSVTRRGRRRRRRRWSKRSDGGSKPVAEEQAHLSAGLSDTPSCRRGDKTDRLASELASERRVGRRKGRSTPERPAPKRRFWLLATPKAVPVGHAHISTVSTIIGHLHLCTPPFVPPKSSDLEPRLSGHAHSKIILMSRLRLR
ncbi:unnamed protein product [Caenorhabditis auriculariae]|uniref:Uncharacterized protein n=1 Tax=Caenorhabditis auriculariae TaxID=2777116 RepID=A0A8S1GTJ9_9PELO|nr:unnamed protein product [Caenorhabditis auriculariae]